MATTAALPLPTLRRTLTWLARVLGALLVLSVGIDHLDQYYADSYSAIPTIGTLFALNFVAASAIAVGLLAPLRRVAGRRHRALLSAFAVGGIGGAGGSLAGLLISEDGGLFGFTEFGYRPPIVLSIALEVATVAVLALFLVLNGAGSRTIAGRRAYLP